MNYFRIENFETAMRKLEEKKITKDGDVEFIKNRGGEYRFVYKYKGQSVFTFGVTRGSKQKEVNMGYYVKTQMKLNNQQFREFHDCQKSKGWYNKYLIDNGHIKKN